MTDGTTTRPPRRRPWAAAAVGVLDGAVVAGLPFVLLVLVALVGWAALGGTAPWTDSLTAASAAWLLGHGVDLHFTAGAVRFAVTASPLGPGLVTAVGAFAAGRRAARTELPGVALVLGVVAAAAVAAGVTRLGASATVQPTAWQGVLLPVLVVVAGGLLGLRAGRPLPAAVRAGVGAVLLVVAVSALAVTALIAAHLGDGVGALETIGASLPAGLVVTAGQLLLLPALVVWGAAWFTGAGFAVGAGTAVGPLGTAIGPLPALPVLVALPSDPPAWAAAALLVPVAAGVVAGVLAGRAAPRIGAVGLGVGAAATAALLLGALAAAASGSAGPGRLADVGPNALLVAALAFVEIGFGVTAGALIGIRSRAARPGPAYLDAVPLDE